MLESWTIISNYKMVFMDKYSRANRQNNQKGPKVSTLAQFEHAESHLLSYRRKIAFNYNNASEDEFREAERLVYDRRNDESDYKFISALEEGYTAPTARAKALQTLLASGTLTEAVHLKAEQDLKLIIKVFNCREMNGYPHLTPKEEFSLSDVLGALEFSSASLKRLEAAANVTIFQQHTSQGQNPRSR